MSRLTEYRRLEQQLAVQLAELEALKQDRGLKEEMEFESKLRNLLGEYNYSLRDVINILDPQRNSHQAAVPFANKRKPRDLKVYKNPHTGELIQTKGGNHTVLKSWKSEHGAETVESWRQ